MMSQKELEELINEVIEKNMELIDTRGKTVLGPLMGIIMKRARGRVKAEALSKILKKRLEELS